MYIKFTQNVNFEGVNYTADSDSKSVTAETGASLIAAGLAVEVDEERTNLTLSTVNGNTVLVGPDGTEYTAIPVAGGSITANVNHRTDALADLLALDGGASEISVANDAEALVVHNGTAGQAVAHRRNRVVLAMMAGAARSVATGTDVVVNPNESYDPLGIYDSATGIIVLPTGISNFKVSIGVSWEDAAIGTANLRKIVLEFSNFGFWFPIPGGSDIRESVASTLTAASISTPWVPAASYIGKDMHVLLRHAAGSSLNPIVYISVELMYP